MLDWSVVLRPCGTALTKVKGSVYVEVGSYLGASSTFIAAGIMKRQAADARLYCIDTWNNDAMTEGYKETYSLFLENTSPYKDIIIPRRGVSKDVAELFHEGIDFLFLDGDHSYEGAKTDVQVWLPKLKHSAIVVMHDIAWAEGVQNVFAEFIEPQARRIKRLPNMVIAWT